MDGHCQLAPGTPGVEFLGEPQTRWFGQDGDQGILCMALFPSHTVPGACFRGQVPALLFYASKSLPELLGEDTGPKPRLIV
jgi:hypothetical protein